jgi:hypothetical protein
MLLVYVLAASFAKGAVTVTGPTNGTCLDVKPGNWTTLGNITIVEGLKIRLDIASNQ